MTTPPVLPISNIGFLALFETEDKQGFLGAILITDFKGIPQEFRCTHPVKPSAVQRSLYGDTLLPHISINLCGIPLLKVIQSKPALILVKDDVFLGVRTASQCPVAVVRRAGSAIDLRAQSDTNLLQKTRLESPTVGRFQPIVLETNPADGKSAQTILEKVFGDLDPLEPFERMTSAVQLLAKYYKRFQ